MIIALIKVICDLVKGIQLFDLTENTNTVRKVSNFYSSNKFMQVN